MSGSLVTPGNVPQDLCLSDRLRQAADEYDRICLERGDLIENTRHWLEDWDRIVDGVEEHLTLLTEDESE